MRITVQEVTVETIAKGKTRYQKAVVAYQFKGEARTQTLVSFANPQVFKDVQEVKAGEEVEVELSKDDKGYTQWTKISRGGAATVAAPAASSNGQATTRQSTFETPEERKFRQLLIVRQSSIGHALEYLKEAEAGEYGLQEVLDTAQQFVDFVYGGHEGVAQVLGAEEAVRSE